MDDDMRHEAHLLRFLGKRDFEARATLQTDSGRMPIRLSGAGPDIRMFAVPKAAHPSESEGINADFHKATTPDGWRDLTMKIQFEAFSPARAEASWLRSAYLAFFGACG
jgi:hypothetical protein